MLSEELVQLTYFMILISIMSIYQLYISNAYQYFLGFFVCFGFSIYPFNFVITTSPPINNNY